MCAFVRASLTTLTCVCERVWNRPDGHAHPYCDPCLVTMAETEMDSVLLTPKASPQVTARGAGCSGKDACTEVLRHTAVNWWRRSACRSSAAHNTTGRRMGACEQMEKYQAVTTEGESVSPSKTVLCICGVLNLTWLHVKIVIYWSCTVLLGLSFAIVDVAIMQHWMDNCKLCFQSCFIYLIQRLWNPTIRHLLNLALLLFMIKEDLILFTATTRWKIVASNDCGSEPL